MNTYLAKVKVKFGQQEKTIHLLVQASLSTIARDYAIYAEASMEKTLDWSGDSVDDIGGEVSYNATVNKINCNEVSVLKKHLPCVTADETHLVESGNYKQHAATEPTTIWETALTESTRLVLNKPIDGNYYTTYLYINESNSVEVPSGVSFSFDESLKFGFSSRSALLGHINYIAKGIESGMIKALNIAGNHITRDTAFDIPADDLFSHGLSALRELKVSQEKS
ncbi:hypothetical protein [Vibrio sp. R78045]|uniref:hypothetical protein n=1 Tax=Vibrio sp. R78045 TaxID=3093868 RepID=UPI0036F1BB78